jgi:hypothetical protein
VSHSPRDRATLQVEKVFMPDHDRMVAALLLILERMPIMNGAANAAYGDGELEECPILGIPHNEAPVSPGASSGGSDRATDSEPDSLYIG